MWNSDLLSSISHYQARRVFKCLIFFVVLAFGHSMKHTCTPKSEDVRIYVYKGLGASRNAHRDYFQVETELIKGLRRRGRIVDNPNVANIFWIPHTMVAHWICDGKKHCDLQRYWNETLRPFLSRVETEWPYFNASGGRDHVFVYAMDEGPICEVGHSSDSFANDAVFKRVHPMIHIGYYGTHNREAPLYRQSAMRKHCFDNSRDIPIPQWNSFWKTADTTPDDAAKRCHQNSSGCDAWLEFLQRRVHETKYTFFFKGNTALSGRHCSRGIRPWVSQFCKNVSHQCAHAPNHRMKDAIFALCPAGWACWSSRYFDALAHMVIPVRLADDAAEPFSCEVPPS